MHDKNRILLIEDNDGDVELIERALAATRRPFEISRFRDGVEALPVLLAAREEELPDVILLDLNMPASRGLDILQRIRSTPKLTGIPVGILTGSLASSDAQRALTMGAARYIHKPVHYDAYISGVGNAVEAMLDARKPENSCPAGYRHREVPARTDSGDGTGV